MKYIIIGSGWYGCHIAKVLLDNKKEIIIVDKENDLFTGSSSKNQNRLHLGFHYPRSKKTIDECKEGYVFFLKKYKFCTSVINNNNYYISKNNSKLNFKEFINKLNDNSIDYKLDKLDKISSFLELCNVENDFLITDELYIDNNKAKEYFKTILDKYIIKDIPFENYNSIESICKYLNIESDDVIINCTYNQLNPIEDCIYEYFVSLIYKIDIKLFAITIMDGPFFSVYPYDIENNLYTITSVEYGVLYKGKYDKNYKITEDQILESKRNTEKLLDIYITNWKTYFNYINYNVSWKAKYLNNNDDRSVCIKHTNNIINIYGGKITGIFAAEKYISGLL